MKALGGVIVIILIAGLGWFYFSKNSESQAPSPEDAGGQETVTNTMPALMAEVVYNDTGFSPSEVILPPGGIVTWKNESKVDMWVASAMHPTHVVYNGTNLSTHCKSGKPTSADIFDQCVGVKPGESWSFTFAKDGDWKYHDHITSGRYGAIKVQKVEEMIVGHANQSAQ
jgi:plastocyanin